MATIIGSTSSSLWTFKCEVSEGTYSIPNNTSPVTVKVYLGRYSGSGSYIQGGKFNITVGCTGVTAKTVVYDLSGGVRKDVAANGWLLIGTVTFPEVPHNDDGGKEVKVTASFTWSSGGTPSNGSAEGWVTLANIPRKAEIKTWPATWTDEQNPTITYSNPAGTAVTSLQACIAWSGSDIVVDYADSETTHNLNKTGTLSFTFNLTTKQREAIQKGVNNGSTSRGVMFFIRTVIGNQTYYSANDVSKSTVTIANCTPTLNPSVRDTNLTTLQLTEGDKGSDISGYTGQTIVRHRSVVSASTGASIPKHGNVKTQTIVCGSDTFYKGSVEITNPKSSSFSFTVADSRGQTKTEPKLLSFVDYIELSCSQSVGISIDDESGETSAIANLVISGNYFDDSFGAQSNQLTLCYRYREVGGADWSTLSNDGWLEVTETIDKSNGRYSVEIPVAGLEQTKQYEFQSMAQDRLGYVSTEPYKVKTQPVFDWSETDFAFNVPVSFNGGISPTYFYEYHVNRPEGLDLNDITTSGFYVCSQSAVAAKIENAPTNTAFALEVLVNAGVTQRVTEYCESIPMKIFVRNYYGYISSWGEWYECGHLSNGLGPSSVQLLTSTYVNDNGTTKSVDYTFPSDGYLYLKAEYTAGRYVNAVIKGRSGTSFPVTVTSGSASNMVANPQMAIYVRKGMKVGDISTSATRTGNDLRFYPLT